MRSLVLFAAAAAALVAAGPVNSEPEGELYALLVAGSNGWYNYRHQADVAHAYQILLQHGVKKENIVTMMYDDIANNKQNPYKNQLFNSPAKKDVYKGIAIDYKRNDVTPENFAAILQGNKTATKGGNGRVIESTEKDRVFVYFTDHGAPGLIAFPNDIMTTKALNDALIATHTAKKFKYLLFYLETCESGSMFEKVLPKNIGVYAVTAANADESSWGTYCDNDLNLPCLGDLFSVNWMEDSDQADLTKETVGQQFDLIKKLTDQSHVMKYGSTALEADPVGWFQGMAKSAHVAQVGAKKVYPKVSVPSRDVELHYLTRQMERSNDVNEVRDATIRVTKIKAERVETRQLFKSLVASVFDEHHETKAINDARRASLMKNKGETVNFPVCHNEVVRAFHSSCVNFNQNESALAYVYVLNQMCNELNGESGRILSAIATCNV